jgi:alkylation response protein AidB-like acyl-CoA dehydrogenase
VDFDLDDDQLALRDAARSLLADHASTARVRAIVDDENQGDRVDRELWKAMAAQGWPGVAVGEGRGGLGLGWVEAAVLLEQVGSFVAPVPVLGTMVALDALVRAGAGDDDIALLLDGSGWAAAAWSGEREVVPGAPGASVAVGVRGDRLVRLDLDGVEAQPAMDRTRAVGWLDPSLATADELGGADAVRRHLDVGAVAYSAELLGVAQRMLDVAVDYAKQRVQFGKPIGSFQAVKHRCADMLVDVEGMRSAVWWAAWCVSVDHPDASVAASTAKSWCSEAGLRVCESALQVHGGVGFTWENDVHLYLKRAQLDGVAFGSASHHLTRLSALLRERIDRGDSVL